MPGYETCLFLYKAVSLWNWVNSFNSWAGFVTCALIIIRAPLTLNSGSGKLLNITSTCAITHPIVWIVLPEGFSQCFCFPLRFQLPLHAWTTEGSSFYVPAPRSVENYCWLVILLWDPHGGIACPLVTWSIVSLRQALYIWASGMKLPGTSGHPYSDNETLSCICLWSWAGVSCPFPRSSCPVFGMFIWSWAQEHFLPLFQDRWICLCSSPRSKVFFLSSGWKTPHPFLSDRKVCFNFPYLTQSNRSLPMSWNWEDFPSHP